MAAKIYGLDFRVENIILLISKANLMYEADSLYLANSVFSFVALF